MKAFRRLTFGLFAELQLLLAVTPLVHAAETIPPGSSSFRFVDQQGNADKPLMIWTHAPRKIQAQTPIVFVLHGVRRNGEEYRDQWREHADKRGFLLVVPEFPETSYSNEAYQRGNLFDESGHPVEPAKWTFSAIEHLFDHIKEQTGNKSESYLLYGHSAGGQVVQRLVLFLPDARYRRAIAANPGYYTMPDDIHYPYGLRGTPATPVTLTKSFRREVVLLLGENDTKRDDPNLRKTPEADSQGLTRLERGQNYFRRCQQLSQSLGGGFAWKLRTVPGAGHSDKQMSKAAASILFMP